jgi:hypothetical protein
MTPREVTDKTLGWHKLAVAKLQQFPDLLTKVKFNIDSFKAGVDPRSLHYIQEWDAHFNKGPEHLFAIALEDSEHADDLRQCSPFGGILTDEERLAYFRNWKKQYDHRRAESSPHP